MQRWKRILGWYLGLHALFAAEAMLVYLAIPVSFGKSAVSLAPVLEAVIPAVVTLRVTGTKKISRELLPLAERPNDYDQQTTSTEVFWTGGSGVIYDSRNGYIITNDHVVKNATDIDVGLSDGRRFRARLIGSDPGSDLSLLQIEAAALPSVKLGNSDSVRVGDLVVAVGNPYGLEGTATLGIVSALMRTDIGHDRFEDYLQIDAQTNPGNSGGALVNHRGELIGINTVVAGGKGQGFSIGFAIPLNMVRTIVGQLAKEGRIERGTTGLVVETLSPEASRLSDLTNGVLVSRIVPNSSAARAGIQSGDVVTQAANKPVRSAGEFMTRESLFAIGTKLPLVVHSKGKAKRVALEITNSVVEPNKVVMPDKLGRISGLMVADILPGNELYGDLQGAQILKVPPVSLSHMAGLEVGDVIVRVDGNKVSSSEELVSRIEQAGLQYRLGIVRNSIPYWLRMSQ